MQIGRFKNHTFEVSSGKIDALKDLTLSASAQTDTKSSGGVGFVTFKDGTYSVGFSVTLNAYTGANVEKRAKALAAAAASGESGYVYIAGRRLVNAELMLTQADISNVQLARDGSWYYAEVKLSFKRTGKAPTNASRGGGDGTSLGDIDLTPQGEIIGDHDISTMIIGDLEEGEDDDGGGDGGKKCDCKTCGCVTGKKQAGCDCTNCSEAKKAEEKKDTDPDPTPLPQPKESTDPLDRTWGTAREDPKPIDATLQGKVTHTIYERTKQRTNYSYVN